MKQSNHLIRKRNFCKVGVAAFGRKPCLLIFSSLRRSAETPLRRAGCFVLVLVAGLFAANVRAGDLFAPIQKTEPAPSDHSTWFSLGPQFGLNINVQFNRVGNLNSASAGPATGDGMNRNYDDGYVHVDSSGNAGGQTWNWGYQNASQVQGSTLTMHSASTGVNGTSSQNTDPNPGFDVAFGHHFGTVLGGKWGLQGAFDFTTISANDSQPINGTATFISDAYSLGTVIPPLAPYSGNYNGPGPLLGDTPTRTTASTAVLITGQRTLDAQVAAFRAGPYYEFPIGKRWSGRLGGGVVLALADTQYTFNETVAFGNGFVVKNSGSGSGTELQAGGYLEGKLLYAVTPETSLFAGAQYENIGTFSRSAGNEQAQLEMGSSVFVLFGVQFNF
jgi:hypothetical protein